jgi:hypothetical protein
MVTKTRVRARKFIVTLTVKNGPFKTRDAATQTRNLLAQQGVKTSAVTKASSGFMFTSKLGYRASSATLRDELIRRLRASASTAGVRKSAVSITTRSV